MSASNNLILLFSALQLGWLLWYFYTGSGGPQELVARLLSIALILQILFMYREGYLYQWLPPRVNDVIVVDLHRHLPSMPSGISGGNSRTSRSTGRAPTRARISSSAC